MLVIEFAFGPSAMQKLSLPFFAALYATNLILPLGLLAVVGAWPPIFMTIVLGWVLFRVAKWLGSRNVYVRTQTSGRFDSFAKSEVSL
jgi:hypothetical protein